MKYSEKVFSRGYRFYIKMTPLISSLIFMFTKLENIILLASLTLVSIKISIEKKKAIWS